MAPADITQRTLQHRQHTVGHSDINAYEVFTLSEAWADGSARTVKMTIGRHYEVSLRNSYTRRWQRRSFDNLYDAWAAWRRVTGMQTHKLYSLVERLQGTIHDATDRLERIAS